MYYAHREISIPKVVSLARQLFFYIGLEKNFSLFPTQCKRKIAVWPVRLSQSYFSIEIYENSSPQGFVVDIYKLLSQLKSYTGTHGLTT